MPAAGNNWSLHRVDVAPLVFCFAVLAAVSSVSPPEMKNPARFALADNKRADRLLTASPRSPRNRPRGCRRSSRRGARPIPAAAGRRRNARPGRQRRAPLGADMACTKRFRRRCAARRPRRPGRSATREGAGSCAESRKRRSRRERGLCHPLTTKCTSRRGLGRPFPRCHLSIKLLDHARQLGARAPLIFRAKIG